MEEFNAVKKPFLNDRKGDLTKKWYVEYQYRTIDGKLIRKRIHSLLNCGNADERYIVADRYIMQIGYLLRKGWRPDKHFDPEKLFKSDVGCILPPKEKKTISKKKDNTPKFKEPFLQDCGGDLSKRWYVEYSYHDEKQQKCIRKRVYSNLKHRMRKRRYTEADKLIAELTKKLNAGWRPESDCPQPFLDDSTDQKQPLFRPPLLHDFDGDLSEEWYVEYSYYNNDVQGFILRRHYEEFKGLNRPERYDVARTLIKELSEKLETGWTPAQEQTASYKDQLEYSQKQRLRKAMRKYQKGHKTIHYHASKFIELMHHTKAKKTYESYRGKIRMFCGWLEKEGLIEIHPMYIDNEMIRKFFNFLIIENQLAKATIEKYKLNIMQFFTYMESEKAVVSNPVFNIPIPQTDEDYSAAPISDDDMAKIIPEMRDNRPQLFMAAMLQYFCFIRPGAELLNLRIKHIDLNTRTITVPKDIAKRRVQRIVQIPNRMYEILIRNMVQEYGKDLYLIGPYGRPGKRQVGENTLRMQFNVIRDGLNLSKSYKWYSFKHTGAGKLLESGATVIELMNQLGHTDIASTYRYVRLHFGERSEHVQTRFPDPAGF